MNIEISDEQIEKAAEQTDKRAIRNVVSQP